MVLETRRALIPGLEVQVPGEKLHHNLVMYYMSSPQLTLALLDFFALIIIVISIYGSLFDSTCYEIQYRLCTSFNVPY